MYYYIQDKKLCNIVVFVLTRLALQDFRGRVEDVTLDNVCPVHVMVTLMTVIQEVVLAW